MRWTHEYASTMFGGGGRPVDVEVVWRGVVIGWLRNHQMDQPHHYGQWESAGVAEFEEAFGAARAGLVPGEVVVWEAGFRAPGGRSRVSPVLMTVFADRPAPRFRFGRPGQVVAPDAEQGAPADGGGV